MTFKILTSDANKVIYLSGVRRAEDFDKNHRSRMRRKEDNLPVFPNRNITASDSDGGERKKFSDHPYDEYTHPPNVVISRHDHTEDDVELLPMPIMNPEDLVGRNFLLDQREDGQKFRERIVEVINAHEDKFRKILNYSDSDVQSKMINMRKIWCIMTSYTIFMLIKNLTLFGSIKI